MNLRNVFIATLFVVFVVLSVRSILRAEAVPLPPSPSMGRTITPHAIPGITITSSTPPLVAQISSNILALQTAVIRVNAVLPGIESDLLRIRQGLAMLRTDTSEERVAATVLLSEYREILVRRAEQLRIVTEIRYAGTNILELLALLSLSPSSPSIVPSIPPPWRAEGSSFPHPYL